MEQIVSHLKTQGKPNYCMEILAGEDGEADAIEEIEYDEYYDQAVAIVAETRQASISYLQRRLKIGYNRAARIVDIMEKEGVIDRVPDVGSSRRPYLGSIAPFESSVSLNFVIYAENTRPIFASTW